MKSLDSISLDLDLPFHDGPLFPPPVLTPEQYLVWIESLHESMKQDGRFEATVLRRPCPVPEMFVL